MESSCFVRISIFVVSTHPLHREVEIVLVATLWHEIEKIVSADQNVEPARVRGIGVVNVALFIFVKNAQTRQLVVDIFALGRSCSKPCFSSRRSAVNET